MEASDIARLRNIINNISRLNDEWFDTFPTDEGQTGIHDALMYEIIEADNILAAPPRNCDVGTAEEQAERFYAFCGGHQFQSGIKGMCSSLCPCISCRGMCHCITKWAQMPYKEGAEDEGK